MLSSLRYKFRYIIGRYPSLFFPIYGLKKTNRKLMVSKNTNICIEGYPRCANTFFVVGLRRNIDMKIDIAHHLHVPAQIIKSVNNDIPAIIIIRSPIEAITSHILRNSRLSYLDAINWYIYFYRPLIPLLDKIFVIDFKSITRDPKYIIEKVIKSLGYIQSISIEVKKDEIYEEIERLDKIDSKKVASDFLTVSRPQKERDDLKKQVQKKIKNEYPSLLIIAEQVYKEFEKYSY